MLADLLTRLPDSADADEAHLVLPVAPVPKGPLLDFDIEGPGGGQAFLLQRADIAAREAAFVSTLATTAGIDLPRSVRAVIETALGFTEAHWQGFRPSVVEYLAAGVGENVSSGDLAAWITLSDATSRALAPFADVPAPLDSAVENPALVVPSLVAAAHNDVINALAGYHDLVAGAARAAAQEDLVLDFLRTLVRYGTHYDLMAVVRAPLDEPFLVKITDRRPLRLSPIRNGGEQSVTVNDARSNHLALRVTDPNARLAHVRARSPAKDRLAYGTFASRTTAQVHAAYAFEPDRDYRIALTFRVAALWRLQLVPYSLAVLLLLLGALIVVLEPGRRDLALLAAPATFAASILLTREPSALGSRLRRLSNLLVVLGVAVLIGVAAWRFVELTRAT